MKRYSLAMNQSETWMKRALELAQQAALVDEVPIGAVIVKDGAIIAEAMNRREMDQSPSAHAELLALELAAKKLGSWRLNDCVLISTLEPCVMCAGAIIQARVKTMIYGAADSKGGAESLFGVFTSNKLNHKVELETGILEAECSQILKDFFQKKRS